MDIYAINSATAALCNNFGDGARAIDAAHGLADLWDKMTEEGTTLEEDRNADPPKIEEGDIFHHMKIGRIFHRPNFFAASSS